MKNKEIFKLIFVKILRGPSYLQKILFFFFDSQKPYLKILRKLN
jgi:hypothetical protein